MRKQLVQLQRQLEILDEEKKETEGRLQEEEKKNSVLEMKGKIKDDFKFEGQILQQHNTQEHNIPGVLFCRLSQ